MILSVHQPNYIPWLGYFYKIIHSDIFIILDSVQFPRGRSVANKNKVCTPNGDEINLTVPVKKSKGSLLAYNELPVNYSEKWQKKHLKTLELNYGKAPFFADNFEWFSEKINSNYDTISNLNTDIILQIVKELNIETNVILLSDIDYDFGVNVDRIVQLCKYFNANEYLSGTGAKSYNDPQLFKENGIELSYTKFVHPTYNQQCKSFVSNLSILDALMNIGSDKTRDLLLNNTK